MPASVHPTDGPPILVTGIHRSGTTWVGRMLAASGAVRYLHEPMNPTDGPRVMRGAVRHAYHYVCRDNGSSFEPFIRRALSMRHRVWARVKHPRPLADLRRLVYGGTPIWWKSLRLRRVLIKDPFALFSAPWFAEHLGCEVVIVVRRAEGVVGSLKRMGWSFDHRHLLEQPLLMRDLLARYRNDLKRLAFGPSDLVDQATLLWLIGNHVAAGFHRQYPHFHFVAHDELSLDPIGEFRKLYSALGLPFTAAAEGQIAAHSSSKNASEIDPKLAGYVTVNSQANLHLWKRRLTPEEIARVRSLTAGRDEFSPAFRSLRRAG